MNLLTNAMQAIDGEGEIWVTIRKENGSVVVEVADSGQGIKEEELNHLFDPFYTTKDDGVGLGLSICYGIVEDHGGTLEAHNRAGGGAIFQMTLPIKGANRD